MSDKTIYNNSDYIKSVGQLSFWAKCFAFLLAGGGISYVIYGVASAIYIITIPISVLVILFSLALLKMASSLFKTAFFAKRSLDAESKEEYTKDITGLLNSSSSYFMINSIFSIISYVILFFGFLLFLLFFLIGALA